MRQDLYQELYWVENNHWWHNHKRRLILQLVSKYSTEIGTVVDIGAGTAKLLSELKQKGWKVTGIDGELEAVKWAKKRGVTIKHHNLNSRLPFDANSFDLVISLDVLEHVKNDKQLLIEMKRVVKPGGIILITVPAHQWLYSYWDKMLGHFRRYAKGDLIKLCRQVKLRLVLLSFYSSFFLLPAIFVRLFKSQNKKQEVSDFQTTPLPFISIPILNFFGKIERLLIKLIKLP